MKISTDLSKSKIARRFCVLFFFCALLPTLCLFFLSFYRVTEELKEQNYLKIKQETKTYGFSLYDRLMGIDNSLRSLADIVSSGAVEEKKIKEFVGRSDKRIFKAIVLYGADKKAKSLVGSISADDLVAVDQEFRGEKQTQIVLRDGVAQIKRIFFIVPSYEGDALKFLLVAEATPDYVWGVGAQPVLPSRTELSVYGDSGQRLIGTAVAPVRRTAFQCS